MSWKYVIVRTGNREVPVIFPSDMVHSMMVDAIRSYYASCAQLLAKGLLSDEALRVLKDQVVPVAAGDCEIDVFSSSGRSETLKLDSRPCDASMMNMHPYTGGYVEDLEQT